MNMPKFVLNLVVIAAAFYHKHKEEIHYAVDEAVNELALRANKKRKE